MTDPEKITPPIQTTEESATIHPINKDTVHRICSGQVILSLATAVKELVENSIDAHATTVEVKLKEYGTESIEVSDNGSGVDAKNFDGMTAKYCTSKLREFSDLTDIGTFGFRGEALASLCALSDMVIVTRHKTADYGTKLELDSSGRISKQTICPRPVGTTVTLTNLFATLPVRKREFTKNYKREYTKMLQILQAYGLISTGVRIICTNQKLNGAKDTVLATHGSLTLMDNIISIFDKKQKDELIPLKPAIPENAIYSDEALLDDDDPNACLDISTTEIEKLNETHFEIEGWISSCSHGSGRSSRDRQFYYINARPCDNQDVTKLVNSVYHRYNGNQYPFVLLNLKIQRSQVDVNLTPDKRQLLVNNQKILLMALKKSLLNTFGTIPSTYKLQNVDISRSFLRVEPTEDNDDDDDDEESGPKVFKLKPTSRFPAMLSQWKNTGFTDQPCNNPNPKRKMTDQVQIQNSKLQKIEQFLTQGPSKDQEKEVTDFEEKNNLSTQALDSQEVEDYMLIRKAISGLLMPSENDKEQSVVSNEDSFHRIDCKIPKTPVERVLKTEPRLFSTVSPRPSTKKTSRDSFQIDCKVQKPSSERMLKVESKVQTEVIDVDELTEVRNVVNTISTTVDEIRNLMAQELTIKTEAQQRRTNLDRLKFKAEINPTKNVAAESELQAEISKESFARMDIIGQFNMGFIVCRLDDDLFIVDQHATDEKYNFEMLQKSFELESQKCVIPQKLQLSAMNELILMENLSVFEMNGFKFEIDDNAEATKKVKLIAMPNCGAWTFGKDDIDELIFMLQDAPPSTTETCYRPSKVQKMFASRACRKSVMIGTALTSSKMKTLIQHMGEIEHPWNCPHGRPTMRHLINLAILDSEDNVGSSDNK